MSKPWFLDVTEAPGLSTLKGLVKQSIGRELDKPGAEGVVREADERGVELQGGEGVDGRERLEGSVSAESTLVDGEEGQVTGGWKEDEDRGGLRAVMERLGLNKGGDVEEGKRNDDPAPLAAQVQ